jgi:hypothetical protein
MSNLTSTTKTKLEKLQFAPEKELRAYLDTPETLPIVTDAYGVRRESSEVRLYSGYFIPHNMISPKLDNSHQRLSQTLYEDYTNTYEWIDVGYLTEEQSQIFHKSDIGFCSHLERYFPKTKLYALSESHYDEGKLAHRDYVDRDINGCYILNQDAVPVYGCYEKAHVDEDNLVWSDHHDMYLLRDDAVYPEDDPDTAYHEDSVFIHNDTYYTCQDAAYEGCIRDYHDTPNGEHYIKDDNKDVLSKFTIGFEVEKTEVDGYSNCGDPVDEQPLFVGWETDSSCGVEGITHVYGLNNLEKFEAHVHGSSYVNEPTSQRCGGHINICDNTSTIKYWHIKSWCGLWWAMYRKRLRNDYSGGNKKVCPYESRNGRYQAIREKTMNGKPLFELRLPNRVRNGDQLIRRFKLSQSWMRCVYAYATEDWTYSAKKYDDVVRGMPNWAYDNNNETTQAHLKATTNLMADVPTPIFNRMRYLIEESKEQLLESYGDSPLGLLAIIRLAYAFQVYIETEPYATLPESIQGAINQYL